MSLEQFRCGFTFAFAGMYRGLNHIQLEQEVMFARSEFEETQNSKAPFKTHCYSSFITLQMSCEQHVRPQFAAFGKSTGLSFHCCLTFHVEDMGEKKFSGQKTGRGVITHLEETSMPRVMSQRGLIKRRIDFSQFCFPIQLRHILL